LCSDTKSIFVLENADYFSLFCINLESFEATCQEEKPHFVHFWSHNVFFLNPKKIGLFRIKSILVLYLLLLLPKVTHEITFH